MPTMHVQLKKGRDGPPALSCVRPDGSRTWSQVHPFIPGHDLLHLALETTLGVSGGFFGLIASGWELADFAAPRASARMGNEASWVESMVGLLDQERAGGPKWSAAEFNAAMVLTCSTRGVGGCPDVTDAQLDMVRRRHRDLLEQWAGVPPGGSLETEFVVAEGGV